jgi:hypothetical protein
MYINEGQSLFLALGAAHRRTPIKVLKMHSTCPFKNPSFYHERACAGPALEGKRENVQTFIRCFEPVNCGGAMFRIDNITH